MKEKGKVSSGAGTHPVDTNRTFLDFAVLALKGACMGIADVIPGVSGGTIAFMLGIYEDLIKAIKSFDIAVLRLLLKGRFKEALDFVAWRFLGALFFGIAGSIVLLSKPISWLLTNFPVLVNAFFFGLILMTVPIIGRTLKLWKPSLVLVFLLSTAGTYFLVQMVPAETPEAAWFIFLSGAIAICAMILPGISGAFILLLLGKYQYILEAVHQREIAVLLIFIAGMAVGILSFVRILEWLFRHFHDLTIAVLTGFVLGSLNKIWPWKEVLESVMTDEGKVMVIREMNTLPPAMDGYFFLALLLATAGCLIAFLLHALPQKHLKKVPAPE